jgi:hypothetical protein
MPEVEMDVDVSRSRRFGVIISWWFLQELEWDTLIFELNVAHRQLGK